MSEFRRPINYSRRRKVVGGLLAGTTFLTGAVAGKAVDDKLDERRANSAQPYCIVEAEPGDSVNGILSELSEAGDRGNYDVNVLKPDGGERQTLYAGERGVPTLDAMQPGDTVEVGNVDPRVCIQIGGVVMNDADRAK